MSDKLSDFMRRDAMDAPCAWVQWKGTNVCCDIHCSCGADLHFDGYGMYAIQCEHCGQKYEVAQNIRLHPIDEPWTDSMVLEES